MSMARRTLRGFTLVEIVVTIAVSGIVIVFATLFIKTPIDAYFSQSRHAELLDSFSVAWPQIERDIHSALPNSVRRRRNGSIEVLEMLNVVDSARYITTPNALSFTTAGVFRGVNRAGQSLPGDYYMYVNNIGAGPNDAYALPGVLTPRTARFWFKGPANGADDIVEVAPVAPAFTKTPPGKRIYLIDTPVTYLCDETAGTIYRYTRYSIAAAQSAIDTDAELVGAGAVSTLVARNIFACAFGKSDEDYISKTGQIVTLQITAKRNNDIAKVMYRAAGERLQ